MIAIIGVVLFVGLIVLLFLNSLVDAKRIVDEENAANNKIVTRSATWKDGARAIGMDVEKYSRYAGALTERYPLAMDNLIKMEWLAAEMNSEEKNRVRYEFEQKFDEVVREADRKQREKVKSEIEDVLKDSFKENEYVK